MKLQTAPSVKKRNICLHLLLVAAVFLYLYSPFLDHWFGNEAYARHHTHIPFAGSIPSQISYHSETDSSGYSVDQDHHEEGALCLLDIDALLALLIALSIVQGVQLVQHLPLVFGLILFYFRVSIIHFCLLDPPPTI